MNIYYIHTDHLNTPRIITQPSDNKQRWRWDIDPFATTSPNKNPEGVGSFDANLSFPGQRGDGQVNLRQNWHRDYDLGGCHSND